MLPPGLEILQQTAASISNDVLVHDAAEVDANARWPERSLRTIAQAGFLGLLVPKRLGGHETGMLGLVVVTEEFARGCPSTALCFGMHCVATAVLAAKATAVHEEKYLRPIARGEHFTSLALSEAGTGTHFYWPQTRLTRSGDHYIVDGTKQFVTSGGFADSYVVTTASTGDASSESGEFSALVLDNGTPGVRWTGDWQGFGMRGNASKTLELVQARVPVQQLLGKEGDEVWYVFEVIAPYFLMAMSGIYLGIASAALDAACTDVQQRSYGHTGGMPGDEPVVQLRIAELWLRVQQARELVRAAARRADVGDPSALPALLGSKIAAVTAAVDVSNEAMTLGGGRAYRQNGRLAQALRDARAGHVMAPATDILHLWLGRAVLGMPLL